MNRTEQREYRTADAKNRSWRTFLQGLAIDVAVGLSVLVLTSLAEVNTTAALVAFGVSAAKTVVQSAAAYVMRTFVDPRAKIALPPSPPGEPAVPNKGEQP